MLIKRKVSTPSVLLGSLRISLCKIWKRKKKNKTKLIKIKSTETWHCLCYMIPDSSIKLHCMDNHEIRRNSVWLVRLWKAWTDMSVQAFHSTPVNCRLSRMSSVQLHSRCARDEPLCSILAFCVTSVACDGY